MKRTLFFDLESTPLAVHTWGMYEQDALDIIEQSYLLTIAYKWLDEKETKTISLPDFPRFKRNKHDDKDLVIAVWKLFDEADIIIGHHAKAFDIKKMNAQFIKYELDPPSRYKVIDTRQIAKRVGLFPTNKLDHLGEFMGEGRKKDTGGYDLWTRCMNGDLKAFKQMASYNKQDVVLLEKIYLRFRPWIDNHPHVDPRHNGVVCPNCGSGDVRSKGKDEQVRGWKDSYKCKNCHRRFSGDKLHEYD